MNDNTHALSDAGVSIWLDDLSRSALTSGTLSRLIGELNVVGVTTNPTIFAGALTDGQSYAEQVSRLAKRSVTPEDAVFDITTDDVTAACDLFMPVYEASRGIDGRVSIEVSPTLAHDAPGTIDEAKRLWAKVNRPNALIKIPATLAGLDAIVDVIAAGISVNVTLIFSLERYRSVIEAYLEGLEKAVAAGRDVSDIHSVASFFVSRVDTEVDKRLQALNAPAFLKSRAGVANARLAYDLFERSFNTERAVKLLAAGANAQRPLWASTGVKDPALPDTLYVTELVAGGVVNTMPEKTLHAVADHAIVTGDTIRSHYDEAHQLFDDLKTAGIDFDDVTDTLEEEGLEKFIVSWGELLETVRRAMEESR